jgi:hypothetical protein
MDFVERVILTSKIFSEKKVISDVLISTKIVSVVKLNEELKSITGLETIQ